MPKPPSLRAWARAQPLISRFHGGAQKGQLTGQGHVTSALRGWGSSYLLGPTVQFLSPGGEGLHRGMGVRSEVGTYRIGCGRTSLGLGLQGRALGGRDAGSGSEKATWGRFCSLPHTILEHPEAGLEMTIRVLLTTRFLCLISDVSPGSLRKKFSAVQGNSLP